MTTNYLLESDDELQQMLADLKASIKDLDDTVTSLEARAKQRASDWDWDTENTEEDL